MNLAPMVEKHPQACQRHRHRVKADAGSINGIHPRDSGLQVCRFVLGEATGLIGGLVLLDERHDAGHLGALDFGMLPQKRGQGG
jgi:hypothetical protein